MRTIDIYEVGEKVLIEAVVMDIIVEQGKIKYVLKVEHTNNELEHTFSEKQMFPITKESEKEVEEVDDIYEAYDIPKLDYRQMYLDFEKKYNDKPCQMSRLAAFKAALDHGDIDNATYHNAYEYYGPDMWTYVGD